MSQRSTGGRSFGEPVRVRMDGTRAEPDDAPRGKPAATAYERYKQQLNALFDGNKPLPDHLREMLATRPGAAAHGFGTDEDADAEAAKPTTVVDAAGTGGPRRKGKAGDKPEVRRRVVAANVDEALELEEALRRAASPREVQAAVLALRSKGYALPRDGEVLGKILGVSDEGVLELALQGLVDLVKAGEWKGNATLLKTRAKNVALLASSSSVRELCAELQTLL